MLILIFISCVGSMPFGRVIYYTVEYNVILYYYNKYIKLYFYIISTIRQSYGKYPYHRAFANNIGSEYGIDFVQTIFNSVNKSIILFKKTNHNYDTFKTNNKSQMFGKENHIFEK